MVAVLFDGLLDDIDGALMGVAVIYNPVFLRCCEADRGAHIKVVRHRTTGLGEEDEGEEERWQIIESTF